MVDSKGSNKVFLGGTCGDSTWRDEIIPKLTCDYFNPIVPDWNEEAYQLELVMRETCDYCLYNITSDIIGVYSIAEVIDDANKRPKKTVFCFCEDGFDEGMLKSLTAVGRMVEDNGATWIKNFDDLPNFLND